MAEMWTWVAPDRMIVVILSVGAALLFTRRVRLARSMVVSGVALLVAFSVLPIDSWMLGPLEGRFPPPAPLPQRVDGIVVLGGGHNVRRVLWGRPGLTETAERVVAFAALARQYPNAKLVVSDGRPAGDAAAAEQTAKSIFEAFGVDPKRLDYETRSQSTYDNARFSYAVAKPKPGDVWLLITSAAHMPRAIGAFRNAGWEVTPYPVDYLAEPRKYYVSFDPAETLRRVSKATREWVAIVAYYLTGRTAELLPPLREDVLRR